MSWYYHCCRRNTWKPLLTRMSLLLIFTRILCLVSTLGVYHQTLAMPTVYVIEYIPHTITMCGFAPNLCSITNHTRVYNQRFFSKNLFFPFLFFPFLSFHHYDLDDGCSCWIPASLIGEDVIIDIYDIN